MPMTVLNEIAPPRARTGVFRAVRSTIDFGCAALILAAKD
jgi:hypothetical protein